LDDPIDLSLDELARDLRLQEIVDARAAAAEIAFAELDEPKSWDPTEQRARLLPDALTVRQMARVVVGDGDLEWSKRQIGVGEHLAHVARAERQSAHPRLVHPVGVFLHRGAASGR